MAETRKVNVTVGLDTLEWLRETYPDALSDQEALRMAISDARMMRRKQQRDSVTEQES